jgi:hypothetical protein
MALQVVRQLLNAKRGEAWIPTATAPERKGRRSALNPIYVRIGSSGDTACQVFDSLRN